MGRSDPGIFWFYIYYILIALLVREFDQLCKTGQLANLFYVIIKIGIGNKGDMLVEFPW